MQTNVQVTGYYMRPDPGVKGGFIIFHPTGAAVSWVMSRTAAKAELRKWQTGQKTVNVEPAADRECEAVRRAAGEMLKQETIQRVVVGMAMARA